MDYYHYNIYTLQVKKEKLLCLSNPRENPREKTGYFS